MSVEGVQLIPPLQVEDVISVLSGAFADYPVMTVVVGTDASDVASRIRKLVGLFVMKRVACEDPMLGIYEDGQLVAAAVLTAPISKPVPPEFASYEESVWQALGADAKQRYAKFCEMWSEFAIDHSHYHVNMIGVHSEYQGKGFARQLLEWVHTESSRHQNSSGVSLSTEAPENVSFYQKMGYEVRIHRELNADYRFWGFYRSNN